MNSVNHFNFISPLDPKVDQNTFYVYFFLYQKLSYLKKILLDTSYFLKQKPIFRKNTYPLK